jgi:hypothetical protein
MKVIHNVAKLLPIGKSSNFGAPLVTDLEALYLINLNETHGA